LNIDYAYILDPKYLRYISGYSPPWPIAPLFPYLVPSEVENLTILQAFAAYGAQLEQFVARHKERKGHALSLLLPRLRPQNV
jgi:hypothetical protein